MYAEHLGVLFMTTPKTLHDGERIHVSYEDQYKKRRNMLKLMISIACSVSSLATRLSNVANSS